MQYVRLGTTGLKVSQICLGMMSYGDPGWRDWVLPYEDALPLVRAATEAGITCFDTADVYSVGVSEEVTGRMLREVFDRREDYVLATKVRGTMGEAPNDVGLSRGHILDGIDASLRRLGVDHVDLYQIHRWDDATPITETMEALHDCVTSGKVRYIGASSMYGWQFAKAQATAREHGWTPFVTMQNHHNLLYREEEREMNPQCVDMGVGTLPWSPLARGVLARPPGDTSTTRSASDTFSRELYGGEQQPAILEALGDVADAYGVSRATVALAWLLTRPGVTAPIIGATKADHLDHAIAAVDLELTFEQIDSLEAPYLPRPVLGHS